MKYTVYRKRTEMSTLSADHVTLYTCRNRKCEISPIDSGARFLTTRRCSLQPITLYFDPNGGTAEYTQRTANVARRIKEFPVTTLGDKHLFGWYDNDGTLVSDQDVASVRTQYLKARWVDPTVVTLDPNGGTCDTASVNLYKDVVAYNLDYVAAKGPEGTNFIGWFTAASGGTQVKPTTAYNGAYTKLYAHYISEQWPTQFEVTTDAEHNKAGIYSATRTSTAKPVYVDWGDGLTDTFSSGNISQATHAYQNPGTYTVRVSDNIKTFYLSANSAVWYQITSQNYYTVTKILSIAPGVTSNTTTYCFSYLNELTEAVWPTGTKTIPNYAFYYCQKLRKVDIPEGTMSIGQYAFAQCRALCDFTLPSTLTTLNTYSFQYCFYNDDATQLRQLVIPEGVTAIPNYCFDYCYNLNDVSLPSTLTSIGQYAFRYCWYYAKGQALTIPEGVTDIGNYAFDYANYLNTALPSTLVTLGTYVFRQCQYELVSITIPEGVATIGTYAFYNCKALKDITIPSSVTTIGNYALAGCIELQTMTVRKNAAPTVSAQTFGNNASTYTGRNHYNAGTNVLNVPAGSSGYTASYWNSVLLKSTACGFRLVETAAMLASRPFQYVEFNPNGGTGGGMVKCYIGMDVGHVDVAMTAPEGKVFDGWWTMRDGGMKIEDGTIYEGDWQIAYAHWKDL